jgi:glycosyltransferase involved in cell wall biosynthesis
MPVRDGGAYLLPAVTSILQQQKVQFELLIIDDHSIDQAISEVGQVLPDSRIRVLMNQGHGLVDALNTGLSAAHGELIARMDADDIAHPKRLTIQQAFLESQPNIDICGCTVELFSDDGIGQGYAIYEQWINQLHSHADIEREFFIECSIAHPSVLLHRSVFESLGGYQDNGWPEDYDLFCRALLAGYKFGKPRSAALLRWRDYPKRTSRTRLEYKKPAFMACKARYLSLYLVDRGKSSCAIWGTGPTGLQLCRNLETENFVVTGFFDINPNMQGRLKRHRTVTVVSPHYPSDLDRHRLAGFLANNAILLVAVSARGARDLIRDYLVSAGLTEQNDFLFVA